MGILKEVFEKNSKAILYAILAYLGLSLLLYVLAEYITSYFFNIFSVPLIPFISGYIAVYLAQSKKLYVAEITGLLSGLFGGLLSFLIAAIIFFPQGLDIVLMLFFVPLLIAIVPHSIFGMIGGLVSRLYYTKIREKKITSK